MTLVNPVDQLFLRLERRNQPMHVGGLQLFTLPDNAGPNYIRELVAHARRCDDVQAPFNRRLNYRLSQPFWVDDNALDLEYHVRHLALPAPGSIRDLLALVSMLHGALLDRARPMWEAYIIEGVTGHRFAVYTKFHHALMDGVSAMRLMRAALDTTPQARDLRMPWQLPGTRGNRRRKPNALTTGWRTARATYRQFAALPRAAGELYRTWHNDRHDADFIGPGQAPPSMLNRRVSGSRRFAAQDYSLSRIRRLGQHFDATINDMVLAISASALRRYLLDNDALPDEPLIALLPVSLHEDGADDSGNRVGVIYASLATDIADPVERLATIQRSVKHWKRRYKTLSAEQIMAYAGTLSAPAGLNLLTGIAPRRQAFNVVISNVPGPSETLYFAGAELTGMYPVSIVLDGQALNISLASYRDSLEFGLLACRRSLPSMQNLLKYLADALDELESAAQPTAVG